MICFPFFYTKSNPNSKIKIQYARTLFVTAHYTSLAYYWTNAKICAGNVSWCGPNQGPFSSSAPWFPNEPHWTDFLENRVAIALTPGKLPPGARLWTTVAIVPNCVPICEVHCKF